MHAPHRPPRHPHAWLPLLLLSQAVVVWLWWRWGWPLGLPVVRPAVTETTALGVAFAAGLAVGFWSSLDQVRELWREERRWSPVIDAGTRAHARAAWNRGVERSLGWVP